MERSKKQLHNFDLPPELSWGKQRYFKCSNAVNPVRAMPVVDADESSNSGEDDNNHAVENYSVEAEGFDNLPEGRSSDNPPGRLVPPPALSQATADPARKAVSGNEDEISATREKLMVEYKMDISKLRERIRKNKLSDEENPAIKPACGSSCQGEPSSQPVNSKSKMKSTYNMPLVREVDDPGSENRSTRTTRRNVEKKEERPKFSITLSRKEIEEDFIAMTGKKPPRKPNKRTKNVQMRLNALFPGSLLSEVHPDHYKVNENGKV